MSITKEKKSNENKFEYESWKKKKLNDKNGYFIIFQDFKKKNLLKKVSGSALKLYIYLGLHTKNYSGECNVTINTMAKYFNKDERTISYWIKELEDLGLIERIQFKIKEPAHTYLKPY
ncbi:helix-turn-helix domain-containing protein [uncultured Tyzzerella sp.]|uniref:helix-turn-helix domain-containing protein n=1 Tax=uncultured Tyzzerella sp. TaxID=2321398 RepID=UPI002942C2CF|nr:helix-turn-helix domain-containing protein [uncultured Tyzzerella sp.]